MAMLRRAWPLATIIAGVLLASLVQTDFGRIAVKDVRFAGQAGNLLSGLLYIPPDVSRETPAPGVLAVHGYINSRETQSSFAIELARRGYVVLALDQTGHGYSEPPAFAHGFGGPDGLRYLRSLPFVDADRIGLEGHSMGGWTVQAAAAAMPDGYAAMVLTGSSTGSFGVPDGTPEYPRNLLLVFSLFDEFSALMWGAAVPADIVHTDKLKTLFGTDQAVVPGQLYGDERTGNARQLRMPAVTHPGDHLSREVTAATVAWFDRTLGNSALEPTDQSWYWKEIGTLLALLGFAVLALQLIDRMVASGTPAVQVQVTPRLARIGSLLLVLVPVLFFFPLNTLADLVLPASALLPQQITNGVLLWAWGSAAVTCVYLVVATGKRCLALMPTQAALGGMREAVMIFALLYIVVALAQALFTVDFRFWVVALKPLSASQFYIFLTYLPLFIVFFVVLSLGLHALANARTALQNGLMLCLGFVALLALQYIPLLLGGTLTIASQPLLTIVAFQFVPILFMVGMISTRCFNRSGTIWTGALLNGLLVTWYMTAGTATQVIPLAG